MRLHDRSSADLPAGRGCQLTATIDHIANGRFAINVVCGHAGQALDGLVGAPELGHDEWYAYADEWIEILDRLGLRTSSTMLGGSST